MRYFINIMNIVFNFLEHRVSTDNRLCKLPFIEV